MHMRESIDNDEAISPECLSDELHHALLLQFAQLLLVVAATLVVGVKIGPAEGSTNEK